MTRCDSCAAETVFLSPQNDCLDCAQHDPLERAAIALHKFNPVHGFFTWERLSEKDRDYCRNRAAAILTAAIDVDELAEHIGKEHARLVRDHLLGTDHD